MSPKNSFLAPSATPHSSGSLIAYLESLCLTIITVSAIALFTRSWRVLSGEALSKPRAVCSSPATKAGLPQKIIKMVVAYLIYDVPSLRACSETCRSWYTSAFPHLHLTLFVNVSCLDPKLQWPNPIQSMHTLGLLPSVKNVQIHSGYLGNEFSPFPHLLGSRIRRQFSALTNVERLEIHQLDIPEFLPKIRKYLGHFSPTVRSLSLQDPRGSSREIIFFIGSFQNLENLSLCDILTPDGKMAPRGGEKLIPLFTPPLRGRLTIWHVKRNSIVKDMINMFEGIRFSYMDVISTTAVKSLFRACAKTLQEVRLYVNDGEQLHPERVQRPADNFRRRTIS